MMASITKTNMTKNDEEAELSVADELLASWRPLIRVLVETVAGREQVSAIAKFPLMSSKTMGFEKNTIESRLRGLL